MNLIEFEVRYQESLAKVGFKKDPAIKAQTEHRAAMMVSLSLPVLFFLFVAANYMINTSAGN
jgi:hypothetical protein